MVDGQANLHLPKRTVRTTVHEHKTTLHYRNNYVQLEWPAFICVDLW